MVKEVAEKPEREAVEKAAVEAAAREAAEKAIAEAAAREHAEDEAALAAEVAQKAAENTEKTTEVALTQEKSSTTDLALQFIKTLEEFQN